MPFAVRMLVSAGLDGTKASVCLLIIDCKSRLAIAEIAAFRLCL